MLKAELIKRLKECAKHDTCEKTHAAWVEVCPYEKTCPGINILLNEAVSHLERSGIKITYGGNE